MVRRDGEADFVVPRPTPQVPYKTRKAFKIADDYTVPSGTMIIPSFWDSTHDATAYPEPEKFIPERWLPKEDGEQPLADKYPQNYMVWGSGPHKVSFGGSRRGHL